MGSRILVCISAAGASVARWNGKITRCQRFENSDAGLAGFETFLRSVDGSPIHVAVDTVDEDYRFETLPHTSGNDRKQLVERKLKQLYRTTQYYSATLQERDKGKRKDDRFLFCALTDVELLTPWMKLIEARDLPLAGLYPLPTVTVAAATKLKLKSPNLLIISKHVAGLRQTFLKNGRFRITRLTPLRGGSDRTIDRSFAEEVSNTRMYLDALSVTTADETVQVVILDQDNSLATLREALNNARGNLQCQRVPREELVLKLKVSDTTLAATPDALHLHLLGEHVPEENLAPATMRHGFNLYRNARLLYAAAGGCAALGALWFGFDLYRVDQIEDEAKQAASKAAKFQSMYQELTRQFPAAPVSSVTLQQTVDVALRLRDTARTPEALFGVVSDALEAFPTISLSTLAWKHGKYADATAAFSSSASGSEGPLHEVGLIVGEIQPFNGDYRTAVATIRDFADRLRKNPAIADVKIIKLPLDENSRQTLSGSTATRTEQQTTAQFEINVTLREGARTAS